MLRSRSQNIASLSTQNMLPLDSTHNSSFKTPARSLKHGRVVHDENSVYGHPKTVGFAGRKKQNVLFSPPAAKVHPQSGLATDKARRSASNPKALVEITNKTPFRRTAFPVTPEPASLKPSKSFAVLSDDSVAPSASRISSTRKKLRLPKSVIKGFETPETKGNYWDVSDVTIEASLVEEASIMEEDYDDVEYAPPTAIDPKFDPGFDMPDYKEVGATLMSLFRQAIVPDDYDPVTGFDSVVFFKDLGPVVCGKLDLPEIFPEPFPLVGRSNSCQKVVEGARSSIVACQKVPSTSGGMSLSSTQFTSVPTLKSSTLSIKCLSKPCTGRITHTRIPSLSKAKVVPATTQTSRPTILLKSRATSSGHARTASVPSRPTSTVTTHSRSTSVVSRPTAGSKPVAKNTTTSQREPPVMSQPPCTSDDTVLSLLAESANESLGGEFLFHL